MAGRRHNRLAERPASRINEEAIVSDGVVESWDHGREEMYWSSVLTVWMQIRRNDVLDFAWRLFPIGALDFDPLTPKYSSRNMKITK